VTGPTGRSAPAPLSATSASTGWGEVSLSTCGATSPPASRPPSSSLPLSSVSATPHLPGSAPFRGPASGTRGCWEGCCTWSTRRWRSCARRDRLRRDW